MDLANDGAYSRTQNVPIGRMLESRASAENQTAPLPRQLQKKRSYQTVRKNGSIHAPYNTNPRDSTGVGEITRARKGSIRNAVRRFFGRRTNEEILPAKTSPPRHAYHRSESLGLSPQENPATIVVPNNDIAQRTLSAPITIPPTFQRTRSPYAVQFPHSARLKPLELGNPFTAPGSQLRRRRSEPDTVATSDAGSDTNRDSRLRVIDNAAGSIRRQKRRSRSAGEMTDSQLEGATRSENVGKELQNWRESFQESLQGSVLRTSGFKAGRSNLEEPEDDTTPMPTADDPFDLRSKTGREIGSPSAFGTELSHDLEDRVAKLEAGLRNFRGQLAQMSSERHRGTVVVEGVPIHRRTSSGGRTASMLALDLQQDIEPSNYKYDYRRTARPSTSPRQPRTPTHADPSAVTPDFSLRDRAADDPFVSPTQQLPAQSNPPGSGNGPTVNMPPQHTFASLYEMLSDERSARRKLERQMNGLRHEIAALHYQVSLQSNPSQRSSYYAPMDPMVGSSRLHALLRDAELSPPSTSQSQQQESGTFLADQAGLISRFSGSESEAGGAAQSEEPQTPYETPQEEHFSGLGRNEGGMF